MSDNQFVFIFFPNLCSLQNSCQEQVKVSKGFSKNLFMLNLFFELLPVDLSVKPSIWHLVNYIQMLHSLGWACVLLNPS